MRAVPFGDVEDDMASGEVCQHVTYFHEWVQKQLKGNGIPKFHCELNLIKRVGGGVGVLSMTLVYIGTTHL